MKKIIGLSLFSLVLTNADFASGVNDLVPVQRDLELETTVSKPTSTSQPVILFKALQEFLMAMRQEYRQDLEQLKLDIEELKAHRDETKQLVAQERREGEEAIVDLQRTLRESAENTMPEVTLSPQIQQQVENEANTSEASVEVANVEEKEEEPAAEGTQSKEADEDLSAEKVDSSTSSLPSETGTMPNIDTAVKELRTKVVDINKQAATLLKQISGSSSNKSTVAEEAAKIQSSVDTIKETINKKISTLGSASENEVNVKQLKAMLINLRTNGEAALPKVREKLMTTISAQVFSANRRGADLVRKASLAPHDWKVISQEAINLQGFINNTKKVINEKISSVETVPSKASEVTRLKSMLKDLDTHAQQNITQVKTQLTNEIWDKISPANKQAKALLADVSSGKVTASQATEESGKIQKLINEAKQMINDEISILDTAGENDFAVVKLRNMLINLKSNAETSLVRVKGTLQDQSMTERQRERVYNSRAFSKNFVQELADFLNDTKHTHKEIVDKLQASLDNFDQKKLRGDILNTYRSRINGIHGLMSSIIKAKEPVTQKEKTKLEAFTRRLKRSANDLLKLI